LNTEISIAYVNRQITLELSDSVGRWCMSPLSETGTTNAHEVCSNA